MTDREFIAGFTAIVAGGMALPVTGAAFAIADTDGGPWLGPLLGVAFFSCAFAAFHMLLALPLYRFMRKRGWVNWATATFAGGLVGLVPLILFLLATGWRAAFWDAAPLLIVFGGSGLVGGLAFRVALGRPEAEA